MANLTESSQYDAGVYRLELLDPVEGGESGKANAPLKNLANRTKWLKDNSATTGPGMNYSAGFAGGGSKSVTFNGEHGTWVVGMGVQTDATPVGIGIYGINMSTLGYAPESVSFACGVYGEALSTSADITIGAFGLAVEGGNSFGVMGKGGTCGVQGESHVSGSNCLQAYSQSAVGNLFYGWTEIASVGSVQATISRTGVISAKSTTIQLQADYAEYFEWDDGNTESDDRIGLCVVPAGNKKVRLYDVATDQISDVIGVVSGTSAITANDAEFEWGKRFLHDDYGRAINENVSISRWKTGAGISEVQHAHTVASAAAAGVSIPSTATTAIEILPKENPLYDKTAVYIPRSLRPEWSVIGLLGQVYVKTGQPIKPEWVSLGETNASASLCLVK